MHNFTSPLLRTILCALMLTALTGCLRDRPRAIVPVQKTALEQYAYADQYRKERNMDLIIDQKEMRKAREVVIQTFEKVEQNFPDDRKYTPLARLVAIEMRAVLDTNRIEMSQREMEQIAERANAELIKLAEDYPEYEFIQAKTLYDRALCYKRIAQYDKAQELFLQVRDQFIENKDETISNIAERANYFYNKTYTPE